MAICLEFLIFYLSVVSVVDACGNGEFTQHQGTDKTCGDKLFAAFNVPSVISCAATCQRYSNCTSFFYFDTIQKCEGCTFVNQATGQSTTMTSSSYYTRSVKNSEFVGCFGDCTYSFNLNDPYKCDAGRAMKHIVAYSNMTTKGCSAYCSQFGLLYIGTQNAEFCSCSNENYNKFGEVTRCSSQCNGNASEICGGIAANSVYKQIHVC